ncbi:MAG: hypothetical protein K0S61_931 [Anaerocolumna sp.]|nr:hypothetical protein [Anaerocolumna sp.]
MDINNQSYILPFSAKSREALDSTFAQVIGYLKKHNHINMADASWTLQKGRRTYEHRKVFVTSRLGLENETFHICANRERIGEIKRNLVFVLPGTADITHTWKTNRIESGHYPVLKSYERAIEQITDMLPAQTAVDIWKETGVEKDINCYKAFLSGYAITSMLIDLGVVPTALAGTGIGELGAMVCAGGLNIGDALDIISKYGELPNYDTVYEKYNIGKKLIPVMRKAGNKVKQHMDEAVVIKLGSTALENDITRRCMNDVSLHNVISLMEHTEEAYITNVYNLIGNLWCKGIGINWDRVNEGGSLKRIVLPTYVFDKKEFDSDVPFGIQNSAINHKPTISEAETTNITLDPTEVLKNLWREALGIKEIRKEDDFFDNGGCSLSAIMLSSKIKEILKIDFPLSEIFYHSTFEKMQKYLRSNVKQDTEDIILKLGHREYYEASSAQSRMFAVNAMIEDAIPYNFASIYNVRGKIDKEKIQNCFSVIVQRHEAFRTRFDMIDGEVVQIIDPNVDFKVKFITVSKESLDETIKDNILPFDLGIAPLLRVVFISLNAEEHVMIMDMHHIISDQSSLDILLKEIGLIYRGEKLPELEVQYKDFAKWQNDSFRNGKVKKQLNYWKEQFAGDLPVIDLYTDFDRPEVMSYEGGKVSFIFDKKLNDRILTLTKKHEITPYMFIMAALNIMLWRYTNQKDIVIGTAIAGRRHAKLETIIGMFVNTLAIKTSIDENAPLKNYYKYIKEIMVHAYENQDCQFDMLVEELEIPKNLSRNPLFDILFNYINIGTNEAEIEGLSFEPYENGKVDAKFDISFTLEEKERNFYLDIEYSKALYKEETLQLMGKRLIHIISEMLKDENLCLQDINMMTEEERDWLIDTVNQTKTCYPSDKTVLSIFEQCVRESPEAIAIEWLGDKVTYRQLNNMANQLANKLSERNIGYQDIVPILLERGYMQIVSMFGIMKLGAVYLPVDPKYPQDRIDFILEDSKSNLIITESSLNEKVNESIDKLLLDAKDNILDRDYDTGNESLLTPKDFNSEDLIYIIYTSGSTGKPKGTLLQHKNVVRVVKNTNYIEISKNDRIMQISNYVFDCSVFDIYSALLNGASLVIIPRETSLEIPLLADFIKDKEISAFCISTALFHMLVDWKAESLINVRKVIVAGEQISLSHAKKAVEVIGKGKLINCYGPTESAVFATYFPVDEVQGVSIVPIGYPLANTTVYVLDENRQLAPINVAGELCLGGDGIGKGYLNRDELTEEKFITLDGIGGKRVYRTGDRVMWNSNRELVFLGRMDFQIKLRGFRVELGEVERQIISIEGIKNAVIVSDKDNLGTLYMTAYYTLKNYDMKDKYDKDYLIHALESKLPEYMIPSKFMLLRELPLNFSGKVDRKALPKVQETTMKATVKDGPRTQLESTILNAMQKVLDISEMGIRQDFFSCGGQSIKAIALVKELSKLGVEVKVNEIFLYQTAEKIAAALEPMDREVLSLKESEHEEGISNITLNENQIKGLVKAIGLSTESVSVLITAGNIESEFSFSSIQKGHMTKGSDYSGFTTSIASKAPESKIRAAIENVIIKNQLLHCTKGEGKGQQIWLEHELECITGVIANYISFTDISVYEKSVKEAIISLVADKIMLRDYTENELLWRLCVLKESYGNYLIIWGADHLIFDGMSGEIIKRQIESELGKGKKEEIQPTQSYKEYVEVLEQGPYHITQKELIDKFYLETWRDQNNRIMKVLSKESPMSNRSVKFIIPLLDKDIVDIWRYAFNYVTDILRNYTKIDTIPYVILDYGRSYCTKEFYNCVGEFLDLIPVISGDQDNDRVETIVQICREFSVNFLSLLGEERFRGEYPKLTELIGKYYFNEKEYCDFILYNFQGFVTEKEKEAFAGNDKAKNVAGTTITVNYDNTNLYIEMESITGFDEELLRNYELKDEKER